jgi:hypothetical protein
MPADGVSLPTTLAQMGSVAKTQAKGQQVSPQVTPFSGQKEDEEEIRVQRVKETTSAEKNRVTGESEEKDKRKRRRLKRNSRNGKPGEEGSSDPTKGEMDQEADKESSEGELEQLGALIDLRV